MPLLTKNQVAIRIAVIITVAEVLIMSMLSAFPPGYRAMLAMLDGVLLVVFSTPPIYFWVIRPFVDARDAALAQVSRLASTDPLTQLANRRRMSEVLEKAMGGTFPHRIHGALLLVDLDGFKFLNDAYGHHVGDLALVEIARRLRSVIRSEDALGRLGGDEFIVLIKRLAADEPATRDKACLVAQKILDAVGAPMELNGRTARVGASVGIRLLGLEELDPDTGIREADIAMYRAKQAGGGRIAVFDKRRSVVSPQAVSGAKAESGRCDPVHAPEAAATVH